MTVVSLVVYVLSGLVCGGIFVAFSRISYKQKNVALTITLDIIVAILSFIAFVVIVYFVSHTALYFLAVASFVASFSIPSIIIGART